MVTPSTESRHASVPRGLRQGDPDAESHGDETTDGRARSSRSPATSAPTRSRKTLGTPSGSAYWVNRFGFGKPTGRCAQGEQTGIVRPLSGYSGISMYNMPFGQGESVTPMQMVQAYDAIADGGILRTPQLVESIGGKPVTEPKGKRVISANVASELRGMLRGVLADGGTASGAGDPRVRHGRQDRHGAGRGQRQVLEAPITSPRSSAWCRPATPSSSSRWSSTSPQGGSIYGGSVAAPAFQKIVGWAVPHFGINPCPSPCPASACTQATPSTP